MSGQHTHVWTHGNQTEPVSMTHHHGFGERVLRPTEHIIDLEGVEPWATTRHNDETYVWDGLRYIDTKTARANALSVLAACELAERGGAK